MGAAAVVDQGFRREFRLRKTDEFSSVFAFRRRMRGEILELSFRPTSGASARVGVVVGKKFVRSAVARNLIKRIVRESFRLIRAQLPPRDMVVRVNSRVAVVDRVALRDEIGALFRRMQA